MRAAAPRGDAAEALARNVRQVLGQPLPRVVSGYLAIDDEIDIGPLMSGLDADGAVNVTDVLSVLSAWGTCSCIEDIDGDGLVNITDILLVLGDWGICP